LAKKTYNDISSFVSLTIILVSDFLLTLKNKEPLSQLLPCFENDIQVILVMEVLFSYSTFFALEDPLAGAFFFHFNVVYLPW